MKNQVLTQFPLLDLVVAGQIIFFLIFLAALLWVFRSGSKNFYEKLSRIPIEKEGLADE